MRLKILFFPIILILSIVIIIYYIWPETSLFREIKKKNASNVYILDVIRGKKSNIKNLDQELTKNKESEDFVSQYFPKTRNEEAVMDQVNYLARSSNVFLSDFGITDSKKNDYVSEFAKDDSTAQTNYMASGENKDGVNAKQINNVVVKSVQVNISVIGKYEDIKNFLSKLVKINRMSRIDEISIVPNIIDEKADTPGDNFLIAQITQNFLYMDGISFSAQYLNSDLQEKKLNLSIVEKVREYIFSDTPRLEVGGEFGRTNPFISL